MPGHRPTHLFEVGARGCTAIVFFLALYKVDNFDYGWYNTVKAISRDTVENYVEFLSSLGVAPFSAKAEEDAMKWYYSIADSELVFERTEEKLTVYMLQNPVCFAPVWYIEAMS